MADRRFEKTEKAIRECMLSLLKEKDIKKITVSDICRGAEINRSTFYAHYQDVQDLHYALEKELAKMYLDTLSLYHYDTDTYTMVRQMMHLLKEKKELFSLMFSDQSTGIAMQMIMDTIRVPTLDIWQRESDLKREELDYLFTYFMTGMTALLKKWFNSGFSLPEEDFYRLTENVVKYGLYNDIYVK